MSHAMLQEPQIYLRLVLIFHCSLLSSPKGKRTRWRQPDDDPSDQCHCHKFKRKGQSGSCFILDTIIAFVSLAEKINDKWINSSASWFVIHLETRSQ